MKSISFLLIFLWFNANAQLKYFLEYNGAVSPMIINPPINDLVIDNSLSFGVKNNKTLYSLGLGREDWYLGYFNNKYYTNPAIYNSHCSTFKISSFLEQQFFIIKSKLSLNVGIGAKVYFLNQMKDSLSTYNKGRFYGMLYTMRPSYLLEAKKNNLNQLNGTDLDEYAFITNIPFSIFTNFAIQYSFKKWVLKLYSQPCLMKIKYKTVKSSIEGQSFAFRINVGLGINYPLNFKKKEKSE